MKVKDIFARVSGGAVGAALAVTVPHIGCLMALTPVFVGAGASASLATGATYAAGGLGLVGAGVAAWYGLRPSSAACCTLWGETPRVRLIKGAAVAACAFAAVAAVNTAVSRYDIATQAIILEANQNAGQSVWETQKGLDVICAPDRKWYLPW